MPQFFLTQYSYERFVLIVLASVLLYVLFTHKRQSAAKKYLAGYFIFVIIFNVGHLITYSLLVPFGAVGWYLAALAPFGLVCLLQFAYRFPQRIFIGESRIVIAISFALSFLAFLDYVIGTIGVPIVLSETGYGSSYVSPWIPPLATFLFLFTCTVFIRQALAIENPVHKSIISLVKTLLSPAKPDARKARNFALVVFFEFVNTVFITLYASLQFIPYQTLLAINTIAFLIIYVLYVFLYIASEVEPLSFRFKTISIVFLIVHAIVGVMGSLMLYQFEEVYDEANKAELRYMRVLISDKRLNELPPHVAFILQSNSNKKAEVIYQNNTRVDATQLKLIWEFVPGRIALSSHKYDFTQKELIEEGKRYFTSIEGINYHLYMMKIDQKVYWISYDYHHYRLLLHKKVIRMMMVFVVSLAFVLIVTTVVVKMGLFRHFDEEKKISTHVPDEEFDFISNKIIHSPEISRKTNTPEKKLQYDESIIPEATKEKMEQAIRFIHENYRYDISREGLASLLSMSAPRFGKAFKAYTGKKLGDYINELRIEDAKKSLVETNKPIFEIASEIGFQQLRSFNRTFYQLTGMTPTEYRARFKK